MSETPYSRAVLRSLLPDHKHPLLHLEPPKFDRDNRQTEALRAIFNAAYLHLVLEKEADAASDERVRALASAAHAERRIADVCLELERLHNTATKH
ncbi:MAG: hypothetical protein AB7F78_10010 [Hyphomicrobiaceae bacterium]